MNVRPSIYPELLNGSYLTERRNEPIVYKIWTGNLCMFTNFPGILEKFLVIYVSQFSHFDEMYVTVCFWNVHAEPLFVGSDQFHIDALWNVRRSRRGQGFPLIWPSWKKWLVNFETSEIRFLCCEVLILLIYYLLCKELYLRNVYIHVSPGFLNGFWNFMNKLFE